MDETRYIAVDTGGTFTDFLYSDVSGSISAFKVPSTPSTPHDAIIEGFDQAQLSRSIDQLLHGTTVATNTLLERKLPRVALLITSGFRHLVQIGRQTRQQLYNLTPPPRDSFVADELIFEVEERTASSGRVEVEVSESGLDEVSGLLKQLDVESVAVCFLHSYKNGLNEKKVREYLIARGFKRVAVSSEVVNEYREYERFSTTLVNAALLPVMDGYLSCLEDNFSGGSIHIMQSNGGIISAQKARQLPVRTILSGPAGGVVATQRLGKRLDVRQMISFDMGGTSTDVSLIDGAIHFTSSSEIIDTPLNVSSIDIHTVGAGGGSIARFDSGGILKVGPESVGADPGPAFYGSGEYLSVSDANLLSKRLPSDLFVLKSIHPDRSKELMIKLAGQMSLSLEEMVSGILRVVNSNMERAIKKISVERGFDLREFVLVSFGGAGGLHAPYLARDLGMKGVIVPNHAGVFSALGILESDVVSDFSRTILEMEPGPAVLAELFSELNAEARSDFLKRNKIEDTPVELNSMDVRYRGQSYELNVPFGPDWRALFHRRHLKMYSYQDEEREVEVVNIRSKLIAKTKHLFIPEYKKVNHPPEPLRSEKVFWDSQYLMSNLFLHRELAPLQRINGPAVILSETSTTVIPPDFAGEIDQFCNILINLNHE